MEDVRDECVGLEMKNGLEKDINYPQKFVYASKSTWPKHTTNSEAKNTPREEVMNQVLHAK